MDQCDRPGPNRRLRTQPSDRQRVQRCRKPRCRPAPTQQPTERRRLCRSCHRDLCPKGLHSARAHDRCRLCLGDRSILGHDPGARLREHPLRRRAARTSRRFRSGHRDRSDQPLVRAVPLDRWHLPRRGQLEPGGRSRRLLPIRKSSREGHHGGQRGRAAADRLAPARWRGDHAGAVRERRQLVRCLRYARLDLVLPARILCGHRTRSHVGGGGAPDSVTRAPR